MCSASPAASRCGTWLVPPTNRVVCAPPSDSANSSAPTPQVCRLYSRSRKDTSTIGTARMPTVQISSSVRATGSSPCSASQAPAVMASHSAACGAVHGASSGTSAASSSSRSRVRCTPDSSLAKRRWNSGSLQHPGAGQLVGRVALLVLPERRDVQLGGQCVHAPVGVADPLGAQLDQHPGRRLLGEDATADPVVGLEDQRPVAGPLDLTGRDQAGQAGADDDDIRFPLHAADRGASSPRTEPPIFAGAGRYRCRQHRAPDQKRPPPPRRPRVAEPPKLPGERPPPPPPKPPPQPPPRL